MSKYKIAVSGVVPKEFGGAGTISQYIFEEIVDACEGNDIEVCRLEDKIKINSRRLAALHSSFVKFVLNSSLSDLCQKVGIQVKSNFERKLNKSNIDLVIFLTYSDEIRYLNYTPFFYTVWDLGHLQLPFFPETGQGREFDDREKVISRAARRGMGIFTDSVSTAQNLSLSYGIPLSKIHVTPFRLNIENNQDGEEREKDLVMYPSHFWPHKNHLTLLKAMSNLIEHGQTPKKILFSGLDRGTLPSLTQYVKDNNLDNFVSFLGFLERSELNALYRKVEFVIYPSLLGPTNLPPLEALLANTPCIASTESVSGFPPYFSFTTIPALDITKWSRVMNSNFEVEELVAADINEIMTKIRNENVSTYKNIFANAQLLLELIK